jgi:hypothetical protein
VSYREPATDFIYPSDQEVEERPEPPSFLRAILYSHGINAKFNRLQALNFLANPKRTQREEAKRLGISERHFRRLLHEARTSYRNRRGF